MLLNSKASCSVRLKVVIRIINFDSAIDYTDDLIDKKIGSDRYTPPEYWLKKSFYGDNATVWMIGLSLYSILFNKYPSKKPREILKTDIIFDDVASILYVPLDRILKDENVI